MVTPEELKQLDVNQIIALIEGKLGKKMPIEFSLKLAVLHGMRGKPIPVIDPSPFATQPYVEESLDYDALAGLINEAKQ